MTDLALLFLMTRQNSCSERLFHPLCDGCVFKVNVFEVEFLNGLGGFLIVRFILKKCLKEFQGEGLNMYLARLIFIFKSS